MAIQNTVTQLDFMQVTAGNATPTVIAAVVALIAVGGVLYIICRKDGGEVFGSTIYGLLLGGLISFTLTTILSVSGVLPALEDELDQDASRAALTEQAAAIYGVQLGSDGADELLSGVQAGAAADGNIELFGETTAITSSRELLEVQLVWQMDRWALYADGTELPPLTSEGWE